VQGDEEPRETQHEGHRPQPARLSASRRRRRRRTPSSPRAR
jgi:hypothetical protein